MKMYGMSSNEFVYASLTRAFQKHYEDWDLSEKEIQNAESLKQLGLDSLDLIDFTGSVMQDWKIHGKIDRQDLAGCHSLESIANVFHKALDSPDGLDTYFTGFALARYDLPIKIIPDHLDERDTSKDI